MIPRPLEYSQFESLAFRNLDPHPVHEPASGCVKLDIIEGITEGVTTTEDLSRRCTEVLKVLLTVRKEFQGFYPSKKFENPKVEETSQGPRITMDLASYPNLECGVRVFFDLAPSLNTPQSESLTFQLFGEMPSNQISEDGGGSVSFITFVFQQLYSAFHEIAGLAPYLESNNTLRLSRHPHPELNSTRLLNVDAEMRSIFK
ncbi:MAG: hypothetical protein IPJ69_09245 [Deltaproteobacteria bacterium]|nr:MAG: hypothetical protein IPJ69_09245 [Deltaproteobacteria bacterium]